MRDLRLTQIWVYPIKSLGGIRVKQSVVREKGLEFDRRYMLVDSDGVFLTQRVIPRMALFKLAFDSAGFRIHFGDDSIVLPLSPAAGPISQAVVWESVVEVVESGQLFNRWFSERIGISVKLVYFPEANPRPVDPRYRLNQENVSLADAYPLLLAGEASLEDLNSRVAEPLPMDRFRPNLVFSGGNAFEEDDWKEFRIGKFRYAGVKPCARCAVTTVDQQTGIRGAEPLAALATFRRRDSKVYFGQNVIAIDYGEVFEGDSITVE